MRKVFLDELPRKGKIIDWKNSVGCVVEFIYDDIEGELEILDYKSPKLTIKYNDNIYSINYSGVLKCSLGKILNKYTVDFKVNVGYQYKTVTVIDRKYVPRQRSENDIVNDKMYNLKCSVCGYDKQWVNEKDILDEHGCSVCNNKTIVCGINSIWDTDKWMCDLGVSEDDAKKYSKSSGKKIKVKCPNCGKVINKRIADIYRNKTIACSCSDKIPYTEKFVRCLLDQLDIKYIAQLSKSNFKWCDKYKYDFYLKDYNIIIETHGMQHYSNITTFASYGGRTLDEEQENDKYKKELALKNGINKYIVLDCRYSNLNWMKESIIQSKLNNIFDLDKVDWIKCEEFARKNIINKICSEYERGMSIMDLSKLNNINRNTISKYLKIGNAMGICDYDPKEEVRRSGKIRCKSVEIFKNGNSLGVFNSINELAEQSEKLFGVKLNPNSIRHVCDGSRRSNKGFTFKYVERSDIKCK